MRSLRATHRRGKAMGEFIGQSWWFPILQSVHIVGLTLLVGTIALVDLRMLGVVMRRHPAARVATGLQGCTWSGLLTVIVTGPLLFWSDPARYLHNPAFLAKMALIVVALAGHFSLHRRIVAHGDLPNGPSRGRLAAALSLLVWGSVVVAGRAIADFDIAQFD